MWADLNETQKAMVIDDFFEEVFRGSVDEIDAFIAHRIEEMGEYQMMLVCPSKEELQSIRAHLKRMLREVDECDVRGGWEK
jgi:hypothetical protein